MKPNKRIIENPMSAELIEKYTDNKANIVRYADITNMTSLEQVFNGFDHVILFLAVESENSGHFQCMYISNDKNGKLLNFFDSYGMKIDGGINKLVTAGMNTWGQDNNLKKLVEQSVFFPDRFVYNTHKYQNTSKDVATCGRYAVLNVLLNYIFKQRKLAYGVQEFYLLMKYWMQKYKQNPDTIVADIIDKYSV